MTLENTLKKIYFSPPIYRKGKVLFTYIATIYETSNKTLSDKKPVDMNKEINYDDNSIIFSLLNEDLCMSLLAFIIANPQASILYDTMSYDDYSIKIKFKSQKKFIKFLNDLKKPVIGYREKK